MMRAFASPDPISVPRRSRPGTVAPIYFVVAVAMFEPELPRLLQATLERARDPA